MILRLGKMEEAIKELETCVQLDPSNAEVKKLLESVKKTASMHRAMKMKGRDKGVPTHRTVPETDSEK